MNLTPVSDYLYAKGIATPGETLFIHTFPSDVKSGVMLRPRLTGVHLDASLPGYVKFNFQVIARASNYDDAEQLGYQVAKALTLANVTLGGWYVNYMRPQTIPVCFPLSPGEVVECNLDMSVCAVVAAWQ